ncbi:hypothetical protein BBJ28_00023314 [Nothophytophthora sp. Chile5]|nr:hypothetical protein BBJ28_00023314 [Nothophytophthora sp. Chile5]
MLAFTGLSIAINWPPTRWEMATAGKKRKAAAGAAGGGSKGRKQSKPQSKPQGGRSASAAPSKRRGAKKSDAKKPQPKRPAAEDDDVEVDEEDVAFFDGHQEFSSFLASMDAKALSKPMERAKKPLARPAKAEATAKAQQEDEEMPLEKLEARPRKAAWSTAKQEVMANKLPVKFMDGSVRANKLLTEEEAAKADEAEDDDDEEEEAEEEEGEEDEELDSDVSDMEFEEITETPTAAEPRKPELSAVDLKRQRERRLAAKKVEIAQLCEAILESPEDAFKKSKEHPQQLSKCQQLQLLCRDPDATVQRLSLLSQLSVFLDILPDYRIRLQSADAGDAAEDKGKQNGGRPMKKKVKQMQDFEAALLSSYQKFLKYCAEVVTKGLKGKRPEQLPTMTPRDRRAVALAETGARCLAELLEHKFAFNFHLNLVIALVPMADSPFPSVRQPACAAFEAVFKRDKSCACSYEVVQQISNYVKQKQHRVQPFVIQTLLVMPLDVTMEQGEAARKKAKSDRKKRRQQQAKGDGIAAGLKEAEAVVDRSEREKTQADILHELVLIYFRILKQATYSQALPAVLEGLAKFAFLINLDIMIDLLKVLKVVLREEDVLPLPTALLAVLTGLRTLQGPGGQELMVDEKEFVDILYRLLRRFADGEAAADTSRLPTMLACVEAVFLKRKEIVVERVAAFVKRLLLVAQQLPPHEALAVLALLRALFHRYSKLQQLLESDVDRVTSGEYRADVDDPDFANPYASACWELALLARHAHPKLAAFALATAEMAPSMPNEHARALMAAFDPYADASFAFKPHVAVPAGNPLHKKLASDKSGSRKKSRQHRARQFFVRDPLASLDAAYRKQHASPFFQKCLELDQQPSDAVPAFK